MSGYDTIVKFRRLEEQVNKLGFMFCFPRNHYNNDIDMVALKPRDDLALPIYTRDAEVFVGTLEQLELWVRGVDWARQYDFMLRMSDDKKREKHEVKERERQAMMRKRAEQAEMLRVLKASDRENQVAKK